MKIPEYEREPRIIVPRFHAASAEAAWANGVVIPEIRESFLGKLRLVGGRAAPEGPWWISRKKLFAAFKALQPTVSSGLQTEAAHLINDTVRSNDLTLRDFGELPGLLPSGLPRAVTAFLSGQFGPPGSDIDLRLEVPERRLPLGVRQAYFDHQTGQTVEIWY